MPPRAGLGWPWAIPISPKNCYTSPRSPQFKWAEAIKGRHQACASPPGEFSTAFALLKDPYFPRLAFVSFLPGCYYCLQGRAIPREAAICGDNFVVRVAFAGLYLSILTGYVSVNLRRRSCNQPQLPQSTCRLGQGIAERAHARAISSTSVSKGLFHSRSRIARSH